MDRFVYIIREKTGGPLKIHLSYLSQERVERTHEVVGRIPIPRGGTQSPETMFLLGLQAAQDNTVYTALMQGQFVLNGAA